VSPTGGDDPLRIVRVPGKGRGVRAGRTFAEGEVVDTAPVVVVPAQEWELVEQTDLGRFCFVWEDDRGSVAVALGRGSLFNHSYTPNVRAEKDFRSKLMRFYARRDIEPGEELTINYNGDVDSRDPVGFDVTE
jgi:uncharacterized protein